MLRSFVVAGVALAVLASAPAHGQAEPTNGNAISVNLASYPYTSFVGQGAKILELEYERRVATWASFVLTPQLTLLGDWPDHAPSAFSLNLAARFYPAGSALDGFFFGVGGGAVMDVPADFGTLRPTVLLDAGYHFTPAPWFLIGVGARLMLLGAPFLGWPRLTLAVAF